MSDKNIQLNKEPVSITSPSELVKFAKTLKQVIIEQNLFVTIEGKNYVVVEGWEFAGAAMGVLPVIDNVTEILNLEQTGEIKYRAEVKLVQLSTEKTVGRGVAICSSNEKGMNYKNGSSKPDYVIASMAQTRAIGKAYRNSFAWLMKMAGYEPTPAEEMDEHQKSKESAKEDSKQKVLNGLKDKNESN